MKNLLQLYGTLISLVSSLVLMISIALILSSFVDIMFTNYKFAAELMTYTSDAEYIRFKTKECKSNFDYMSNNETKVNNCLKGISETDRLVDKDHYIETVIKSAYASIINSSIWAFVSLIFLLSHWRLSKKYNTIYVK